MITRNDIVTYNKIKEKLVCCDKSTQTNENKSRKRAKPDSTSSDNEEASTEEEDEDDIEYKMTSYLKKLEESYQRSKYPKTLEDSFTEDEEQYFKSLTKQEKENYKEQFNVIINKDNFVPIKFKILSADLDDYVKQIAFQKYTTLLNMQGSDTEYNKLNHWITSLCKIPFGNFVEMPVNIHSSTKEIQMYLEKTRSIMNKEIYGHTEAKDQIVRLVAQWIANPNSKGNVIGIHGSPGVGKTTLAKYGICKALNRPFAFISLGGTSDSSYFDGHSYTYEGSSYGKIIDILMKAKCMNPVIYFDELDKVGNSMRGQDIINLLIHLTDSTQNDCFQDKYLSEINLNLSRCLFIFTYNDNNMIDPILKDRMTIIEAQNYTITDKIVITTNHLIPSLTNTFGLQEICISIDSIKYLIEKTPKEHGVRNLKRSLENVVSNLNLERLLSEYVDDNITICNSGIDKYLKNNQNDYTNPSISHLYT